jgi:PAS domain S-box-containing protein
VARQDGVQITAWDAGGVDAKSSARSRPDTGIESNSAQSTVGRIRLLITAAILCVAYYLGVQVGFALTLWPHPISTLWPPNSLLLAALLLIPQRYWWILFLAALPAHLAAQLGSGIPLTMVLGWFVSNCSEALIGAFCVRRFVSGPLRFDSFRHVSIFLLFGVLLAALLSSFIDAAMVTLVGWADQTYWRLWQPRFFSNFLASLTVVPVVLTWVAGSKEWVRRAQRWQHVELGLLLAALLAVCLLVFNRQEMGPGTAPALLYLPLPFLLWAAVRHGPLGTSTSLAVVVFLAIWGTAHGQGPFVISSPEDNARSLQLFLIAIGVPMLLLAAVIEERRQTEEALQASEQRSDNIFRSSPDPIAIIRRLDGALIDVNDRWEAMFGFSRAEAVGRTMQDLQLYADEGTHDIVTRLASDSGRLRDLSTDVRDRHGGMHTTLLTAEVADVGNESCVIAMFRDVTEQRRAEREAFEQRQELAHLSRVATIGELSGALAHELNQPLTAILGNAQAAQASLAGDRFDVVELREILQDIVQQDVRAGEVIRRLRQLLKRGEAQFQSLDVVQLVREVLELAHSDLVARNIKVDVRLSPGLPAVRGDRIELQQVLLNLIVNACESMSAADEPATRTLTIRGQAAAGNGVQLSIIDQGPTISPEHMARMFEPFFTTKRHGLGLGLSICKRIVTAHGGRIWATANRGRGAAVHVVLSADPEAQS